jgi:hypothetical protein
LRRDVGLPFFLEIWRALVNRQGLFSDKGSAAGPGGW